MPWMVFISLISKALRLVTYRIYILVYEDLSVKCIEFKTCTVFRNNLDEDYEEYIESFDIEYYSLLKHVMKYFQYCYHYF